MGIFNADVIINIPPAFFSLQKSGLVRVYLTSVFLLLSVPRCFGDQKPQFDWLLSCYSDWYVCSLDPESSSLKSSQCSCNMESFELFSQEEHGLDPSTTSSASSSSSFMEPNEHPRKQCTLSQT